MPFPFNAGQVSPGDLARAVLHDEPSAVGDDLRDWFDSGEHPGYAKAIVWLRAVADYMEQT
jgi:hypothetical protein